MPTLLRDVGMPHRHATIELYTSTINQKSTINSLVGRDATYPAMWSSSGRRCLIVLRPPGSNVGCVINAPSLLAWCGLSAANPLIILSRGLTSFDPGHPGDSSSDRMNRIDKIFLSSFHHVNRVKESSLRGLAPLREAQLATVSLSATAGLFQQCFRRRTHSTRYCLETCGRIDEAVRRPPHNQSNDSPSVSSVVTLLSLCKCFPCPCCYAIWSSSGGRRLIVLRPPGSLNGLGCEP